MLPSVSSALYGETVAVSGPLGQTCPTVATSMGSGAAILAKEQKLDTSRRKTWTSVDLLLLQERVYEEPLNHLVLKKGRKGRREGEKERKKRNNKPFKLKRDSTRLIVNTENLDL